MLLKSKKSKQRIVGRKFESGEFTYPRFQQKCPLSNEGKFLKNMVVFLQISPATY